MVAYRHRSIEPTDVMLASYPRSGSNWMAMVFGELLLGEEVDFETRPQPVPWITGMLDAPRLLSDGGRMIRTHERRHSRYRRALYLVRHPGDVAVSYHRLLELFGYPSLDFDTFFRAWIRGEVDGYGSWCENVCSWMEAAGPTRVIRYEDLCADPAAEVQSALEHIGVSAGRDAIERALAHNSIDRMRGKIGRARHQDLVGLPPTVVPAHSGSSGGWTDTLGPAECELLEQRAGTTMHALGYSLESAGPAERIAVG